MGHFMANFLENKIKDVRLTKTERRIADFTLENLSRICFMTANDLSSELGVSDTSVIRFARSLGYTGYADLQKSIQSEMAKQMENASLPGQASPLERFTRIFPYITDDDLINSMMRVVVKNFEDTLKRNSMDKIEQASKCLIESRNKYIVGFKGSQGIASMFFCFLAQTLPNAYPILYEDSSAYEMILDVSDQDCVIITSFPRYSRGAEIISAYVKDTGAKLIVLTDKATATVANGADILLTIGSANISFNNSYVVAQFIAELICADVLRKCDKNEIEERLKKFDDLVSPQGFF